MLLVGMSLRVHSCNSYDMGCDEGSSGGRWGQACRRVR